MSRISLIALMVITLAPAAAAAQDTSTTICGRVAAVSCFTNQSEVRILLAEPARGVSWRATIPPGRRRLFDARLLTGLDDAEVCVSTSGKPLGRDVVLLRPDDLVIRSTSTSDRDQASPVHSCDGDVEMPRVRREVKASMTADVMRAKLSGVVVLRAIIDTTGAVHDVQIAQSLEPSQDAASREALEKWIFTPPRRNGGPVAMRVSVEMHYTIR